MNTTEIDWRQNCLTTGIHDGRPEAIWNIPLLYAVTIFGREVLFDLIISRIHSDAMQMVEHGSDPRPTKEWAERVKKIAQEIYDRRLQHKVGELNLYYKSPAFEDNIDGAARQFVKGKLNPGYMPLHDHDSINMLCRIIGVSAAQRASQ